MPCLLITYDLNKPGQKYDALYDTIKKLGTGWWHYLDSTWLVYTSLSPEQASTKLSGILDESDSWLVIDVTGDPRQGWLEAEAWTWINKHL